MSKKCENKSHLRETQMIRRTSVDKNRALDQDSGTEALAFGTMLRGLRQRKAISLRRLASRVGISAPYLSSIERQKAPPPSENKLRLIASALDQDPGEFLAKASKSVTKAMVTDPECGSVYYTPSELLAKVIKPASGVGMVDPACGSGQMLLGAALRVVRQQKSIGLREFARRLGISAAHLSNIETARLMPSEETLSLIVRMLALNGDEWLAKAGKIGADLPKIIMRHPRQYAAILRSLRNLDESDFCVLVDGLAQQFDIIVANPPYADGMVREKNLPIDWDLLRQTFAE
jgi:transcriptional regulator with XRE-family HTH domain